MLQKEKDPLNIFVWYISDNQTMAHPSKAINQKGHFAVQDDPTIYFMQIPPPLHTVQPKSIRLGWKNSSRPKSDYFLPYCHSCYKNQVDSIFAELLGRMKRFMSTNSNQQQKGGAGGDISSDISDSRYRLLVSRHNSLRHRSRGIIRTFSITTNYQHYTSTRCKSA